jgi:hypothetical protein
VPDLFTPLAGETLMAFLVRTRPQYEWQDNDGTAEPWATVEPELDSGVVRYRVRAHVTSAEFAAAVAALFPTAPPVTVAPIWPGSANATLGTPVALSDQLVVEGPMAGLLVAVTTPPRKLGSYLVGGVTLDYGIGRISFETDAGDLEPWQYLGFRSAIYTPRSMTLATRARLQLLGGAEGTATPWTSS